MKKTVILGILAILFVALLYAFTIGMINWLVLISSSCILFCCTLATINGETAGALLVLLFWGLCMCPAAIYYAPSALTAVRQRFAGPVEIPIKVYIVKANKEVLYLPHVDVQCGKTPDVMRLVDAEERAIKQQQDELNREAAQYLDLLTQYIQTKQEANAEQAKARLRSLSAEWRNKFDPNRVFNKLPRAEQVTSTNDKGQCTAELPDGDWSIWASTSRILPNGNEEEYRWLIAIPKSGGVELTERNLYARPWQRTADWVDRF